MSNMCAKFGGNCTIGLLWEGFLIIVVRRGVRVHEFGKKCVCLCMCERRGREQGDERFVYTMANSNMNFKSRYEVDAFLCLQFMYLGLWTTAH